MRLGNASNFQIETREGGSEVEGGAEERGNGRERRGESDPPTSTARMVAIHSQGPSLRAPAQRLILDHHSSINVTKALLVTFRILPCSCKLANCLVWRTALGNGMERGEREQEVQSAGIPIRSSFR